MVTASRPSRPSVHRGGRRAPGTPPEGPRRGAPSRSTERREPVPERVAPELQALLVPIATLVPHPRNPRRGDIDAIAASLARFGQLKPVVVQQSTNYVVAGNHLLRAAQALGWQHLAANVVELDDATASAYMLADNRTADLGTYDEALLAAILEEQAASGNLAGTAYGPDDIAELVARVLAAAERTGDPDAVPDVPADTDVYVRRGQRWRLGRHVLLVGDALDPGDVARLLGDVRPTLLCVDPPYGVSLDSSWRDGVVAPRAHGGRAAGHRNTTIAGDTRVDWSAAFALVPSLEVGYVWHAAIHAATVAEGLARIGFEIASQIIWDKGRFTLGRSWYQWAHEPCWVVRKRGAKGRFLGGRDQATIWRAPSPKMTGGDAADPKVDHPTQKPVLLFEVPIANHLRGDDAVYDPCAGSGTAIIAAERLGRRCFALEIEPKFGQIAIERWQTYTGERAVCEDGG